MAINPIQRQIYLNQFARSAQEKGTTPQDELYAFAQANGYSPADIDTFMDAAPGTAQYWVDNIKGKAAAATGGPAGADGVLSNANSASNALRSGNYMQPAGSNLGLGSNMVVSGPGNQAATNSPVTPAQGPAPQGHVRGTSMGAGTAATQPTAQPNIRSTDNRWSGDPTRQPDGSFNPQPTGLGYRGGNLGFGDMGYQRNPYLDQTARDIGGQMFDNWQRNIAPSIRSGAMATGGYGGSRQGVVEANGLNDMNRNYSQALTGMYGQDYTGYQNRGIQRQGQAQSYDLGLRNNDTANWSLDAGINQNNFNNNLASANFGLGVQNQLMNNNGVGIAAGTNIQNTPFDYQKYLNTAGVQAGGAGGTRTGTTTS